MYSLVRSEWHRIENTLNWVCKRTGYIAVYLRDENHWGYFRIYSKNGTFWREGKLPRLIET